MKAGFFQFDVIFGDKQANLQKVRRALMQSDFDVVLLPELFATGSIFVSRQQAWGFAEPVPEGETTQALLEIARAREAYIIGGLVEQEGERLYNTAVIVGPHGFVGKHRKVHLAPTGEKHFTPGDRFKVFDILGTRVGILLCYDIWVAEAGKALIAQGASLIFNPSNFCGEDSPEMITQRTRELSVYTIAANRLGMDHDTGTGVVFIGASQIADPEGDILERAGGREALVIKDIPLPGG